MTGAVCAGAGVANARRPGSRNAAPAPKPPAPVLLVFGEDEFAVKQRARQAYQKWTEELGGMDHEIIDAAVNNSGEALKALARTRLVPFSDLKRSN